MSLIHTKLLILFLIASSLLSGCALKNKVIIDEKTIYVELAITLEERTEGLMNRSTLCKDCGMLFVFEEEAKKDFWMKNTVIPLDMIFIDSELIVVTLHHAIPCEQDPCPLYSSNNTMYVLETNADLFSQDVVGKKVELKLN